MGEEQGSGKLILILGSSGSGKGTALKYLRENYPDFVFPVSCTTRSPRPGEKDGEVYHFINKDEFKKRIEEGDFLEWAVVHGDNYYGTLKDEILEPLKEGKIVVREVDVQGLRSIRELVPEDQLVSLFMTIVDWETLKNRILKRAKVSDEELEARHQSYLKEKEWEKECDIVVESIEGEIDLTNEAVEEAILFEINGA